MADNRREELIIREHNERSKKFLYIIIGFYRLKKQPENIQEMLKVSNLILYCQGNRDAAKEFLIQTKAPQEHLDLLEAIDKALAEANPKNDPIIEMFMLYKLSGLAITRLVTSAPMAFKDVNISGGTNEKPN